MLPTLRRVGGDALQKLHRLTQGIQQRSQQRSVNAEYIEDSIYLVMGRYAMFSVKWSFGKMNPAKNARVQSAMYNMM